MIYYNNFFKVAIGKVLHCFTHATTCTRPAKLFYSYYYYFKYIALNFIYSSKGEYHTAETFQFIQLKFFLFIYINNNNKGLLLRRWREGLTTLFYINLGHKVSQIYRIENYMIFLKAILIVIIPIYFEFSYYNNLFRHCIWSGVNKYFHYYRLPQKF
jgi:hypothetical protein